MKNFCICKSVSVTLASLITVSSCAFYAYADTDIPDDMPVHIGTVYTTAPAVTSALIVTTAPETTVPDGFWLTQDTTTADENFIIRDDFPLSGTYNLDITLILPNGVDEIECQIHDNFNDKIIAKHTFTRDDNSLLLENLNYDFESSGGNFNKYQYMIYAKNQDEYLFKPNSFISLLDGFKLEHFAENDNLSQVVMPVKNYAETTAPFNSDTVPTVTETYHTTLPQYDFTTTAPHTSAVVVSSTSPGNDIIVRYGTVIEAFDNYLVVTVDYSAENTEIKIPEQLIGALDLKPDDRIQIRYSKYGDITEPIYISKSIPAESSAVPEVSSEAEPTSSTVPSDSDDTSNAPVLKGDVTLDGSVDIKDIACMAQFIVKLISYNELQAANGDINNDGNVNIGDLTHLKRFLIGDINSL